MLNSWRAYMWLPLIMALLKVSASPSQGIATQFPIQAKIAAASLHWLPAIRGAGASASSAPGWQTLLGHPHLDKSPGSVILACSSTGRTRRWARTK